MPIEMKEQESFPEPSYMPAILPKKANGKALAASVKPCKVAILGFGTVGSSVAKILCQTSSLPVRLTHVLNRRVERKRVSWVPDHVCWTENFADVLSADVIIELVGGLSPAEEWARMALMAGKAVITANKQLIAHRGPELHELARQFGGRLLYGAAVAGGVPVIAGLQHGLAGDQLHKLCGILNGTCNYILSQIESEQLAFETALKQAQKLGFAEADPRDDIEGFDAQAKLAILARIGLGVDVAPGEIRCDSIAPVDGVDFIYARDLGCTIRQVARAEVKDNRLYASVQPALVAKESPLAHVCGNHNMLLAAGKYGGETVFSGCGAGGDPTAVAVVSDLLTMLHGPAHTPALNLRRLAVSDDIAAPHYVRLVVRDQPGVIAAVAGVFSRHDISIDAVLQKPGHPKSQLPFVTTLDPCRPSALKRALVSLRQMEFMVQLPVAMPVVK